MNINYLFYKENIVLRFTLIFIIGIVLGAKFPSITASIAGIVLSILLLTTSLIIRYYYKSKRLRAQTKLVNSFLFITILLLSYSRVVLNKENQFSSHYSQINLNSKSVLHVSIIEAPIIKKNSIKLLVNVNSVLHENSTFPVLGKLICYLKKDSNSLSLSYGQNLIINNTFQEISGINNPNEFNYKLYLEHQNVYHSVYADSASWSIAKSSKWQAMKYLHRLREYLSEVISKYIPGVNEQGIARAILLGKKDNLGKGISKIYANTGAMHVLAVSGLHVGIVYLVLSFAFKPFKHPLVQRIKPLMLIILIWAYALLTGASPSVLRAATMFTFIAMGNSLKQHISIYNLIAASALLLCLINPFILMEVGFQLSYLAVIGIIYLQPKLYAILQTKYYILDKIWQLTTVSIAAQIATLPISLLYFHQFPIYFWISNLVVIPAAVLIVYSGLFLFIIAPFDFFAVIIGNLIGKLIYGLNLVIRLIDSLPYSLISSIHITSFQCILTYLLIIFGILALQFRLKMMLKMCLATLLVLTVNYQYQLYNLQDEFELTVYNIKKESTLELRDGRNNYSVFSAQLIENLDALTYSIFPNRTTKHLLSQADIGQQDSSQLFSFDDKSILTLNDTDLDNFKKSITVDYAILKNWNSTNLQVLAKKIKASKYVFDSSNSQFRVKDWKKACEDLNLNCYFVSESGAFTEKWKK